MKILLCLNGRKFGGAERMSLLFAKEVQSLGHDVELLLNNPSNLSKLAFRGWKAETLEHDGFVGIASLVEQVKKSWQFYKLVKANKYDLIIFENKYLMQLGVPVTKLLGVKAWGYLHFPPGEYELSRCLFRFLDRVLLCTAGLKKYLSRYDLDTRVVRNFANQAIVSRKLDNNTEDDAISIVSIGHINPVKQQDFIIKIAAELVASNPTVKFYLIGGNDSSSDEYYQKCLALIHQHKLYDNVFMTGHIDNVADYLQSADIYLQPSLSEGLPLAVLEAMSNALPIVASDVDGLPDAVVDGENGFLIKDREVSSYAQAVQQLIDKEEKRQEMGAGSLARYNADFTQEKFKETVAKLFVG